MNCKICKETIYHSRPEYAAACVNCVKALEAENECLKRAVEKKDEALSGVINSCAHPGAAVRDILVCLKPIREALEFNGNVK